MWHLLIHGIWTTLVNIRQSFVYFLPCNIAVFIAIYAYQYYSMGLSLLSLILGGIFVLGSPMIICVFHAMLNFGADLRPFKEMYSWGWRQIDFMIFVALMFYFMLMFSVAAINGTLAIHDALEAKGISIWQEIEVNTHEIGVDTHKIGNPYNELILILGSRVAIGGFIVVLLFVWYYFSRLYIRMPAFVDGFWLRSEEALALTRHESWQIFFLSAFINTSFLSIISTTLPWSESTLWINAVLATLSIWLLLHINFAFATVAYRRYTEGYHMQSVKF